MYTGTKALAASNDWKKSLADVTKELEKGNVPAQRRSELLQTLLDGLAKNAQAERDATGAIDKTTNAFDKNIGALVRLAGTSDVGRGALDGLARAFGYNIERIGKATIVTDEFGNRVRVLPNGKVVKIDADTGAANRNLDTTRDKITGLPKSAKTTVSTPGSEKSVREAERLGNLLNALNGKVVTTTVITNYYDRKQSVAKQDRLKARAGGIFAYEQGGIHAYAEGGIERYAVGGVRAMGPQIVSRPTVLFGEGDGPEAFIPYEGRFRKRAVDLLSQVADDFGLQVLNKRAAKTVENVAVTVDASAVHLSAGLGSATTALTNAMGATGTVTNALGQVSAASAAMTASWQVGADQIGDTMGVLGTVTSDAVQVMTTEMTSSIDTLSGSVDNLSQVLAAASDSASGAPSKGTSKSKTSKGGSVGATAKETRGSLGKGGAVGATAKETRGKLGVGATAKETRGVIKPPGGFVAGDYGTAGANGFLSGESAFSMGSPVNSSRVSAPQQMSSHGFPAMSGGYTPGGGGASTGQGSAGGGPLVAMYGTTIRENVDADVVTAKIGMVLDSRG